MSWEQRNHDFSTAQVDAQAAYIEAEREVKRLQSENESLRKELAVTNPLFETLNSANDRLIYENMELRELVRDYINAPCTTCDCWQDDFRCWNYDGADCGLVARARELGVEVDE